MQLPRHLSFEEARDPALRRAHRLARAGRGRRDQAPATPCCCSAPAASRSSACNSRAAAGARAIVALERREARARAATRRRRPQLPQVPEWQDRVRDATGGRGVDHVLEVTRRRHDGKRALAAMRPGGHIAMIGARSGRAGARPPLCAAARPARHRHQCRQPRHVRGDEPRHRPPRHAPGDRPRVPVRGRGRRLSLPDGRAAFRQGRDRHQ